MLPCAGWTMQPKTSSEVLIQKIYGLTNNITSLRTLTKQSDLFLEHEKTLHQQHNTLAKLKGESSKGTTTLQKQNEQLAVIETNLNSIEKELKAATHTIMIGMAKL